MHQLTDAEKTMIRDRYQAGETQAQIGADFGRTPHKITRILRGLGVVIRPYDVRRFTAPEASDVAARYQAGESRLAIAESLGVKPGLITRILHEQGVALRPTYRTKLSPDAEAGLARRYQAGETGEALEAAYGVTRHTVLRIVRAAGVTPRPWGGAKRVFSADELATIARLADEGYSQARIARELHSSQVTISRVMREQQITPVQYRQDGAANSQWKGGRRLSREGYWYVRLEVDSPYAAMRLRGGYVAEHRLVMAQQLGRPLLPSESVHHIDGNRENNDPTNLQLRQGRHGRGVVYCCADCGSRNIVPCPIDT